MQHRDIYGLLTVPSVTLIAAFLSDRYRSRGAVVISVSILGIAGFAVFLCNVALLIHASFLTSHVN